VMEITDGAGIDAAIESTEGDLYCYLHDQSTGFSETRTILKLDANASPVWIRNFTVGSNIFSGSAELPPALVELGDGILVKYNEESSDFSPQLMRLRKSDGGVDWVKRYQMPGPYNGSQVFSLYSLLSDGTYAYMLGFSQDKNRLLKIAADGSVVVSKESAGYSSTGTTQYYRWMDFSPSGNLLVGVYAPNIGDTYNGLIELDKNFTPLRQQFLRMPRGGSNPALIPYSDSVTYGLGSLYSFGNDYATTAYFQKYNFNANFAQCGRDMPVVITPYSQSVTLKTVSPNSLTLPQSQNHNASTVPYHLAYSSYHCGNNSACSQLQLQGPITICDTVAVYSFRPVRNAGCEAAVLWRMDTVAGQVRVVIQTDTLLQLKFKSSGTLHIGAKIFANCGWLEDSILVQVSVANTKLNLGADTTLCSGNTIRLNAGSGFGSYLWQDGSTDSVYTVTKPGWYHVQVSTCAQVYKDSVLVTAAPPIPFDIGPDRTKCNSDTLRLSAPSGFLNYSWSNNYNISSTTTQNVVVNPLVDTAYYVKAEKTPGCFAYDTVRVKVNTSPPINLGSDQSFCFGDSAIFNAGSGFQSYAWSSGATSQQLIVKAKGTYSVIGTTAEGCKSYDTVRVVEVYTLPAVNLDKSPALCIGSSKLLSAGSYASYQWSTGATTSTISISDIGDYKVIVTDANGCVGSDSTSITTLNPLPAGFLPSDTAICSYGTMELKPISPFNRYLWSSGAITPGLTISQPGLYWLEVEDRNTCKGKDSVLVVLKECMKGFYIPTAFTPNGDRKNDELKPLLFGKVKTYRFTIYNRWGQVIFQTTDQFKGWDGRVAGTPQRSDTFVWTCTYQFEGESEKTAKGTVTVIR
ncbi:MAG: gliding motility-associated C-terminal domain-containing protein, partial [Sphingobacteriales bacterium]